MLFHSWDNAHCLQRAADGPCSQKPLWRCMDLPPSTVTPLPNCFCGWSFLSSSHRRRLRLLWCNQWGWLYVYFATGLVLSQTALTLKAPKTSKVSSWGFWRRWPRSWTSNVALRMSRPGVNWSLGTFRRASSKRMIPFFLHVHNHLVKLWSAPQSASTFQYCITHPATEQRRLYLRWPPIKPGLIAPCQTFIFSAVQTG